jgi:hypothetical protein
MPISQARIDTLRKDPDFRELVKCLRQQAEEDVRSFLEFFGASEQGEQADGTDTERSL